MPESVLRIRDPVPFWPLDQGSGIGFFRISDPGSQIPNPYIWEHIENFLGKNFNNSLKIGPNFFLYHFKNNIIFNFVKFMTTKKSMIKKIFSPLSFVTVFGSGINIPDPQHWPESTLSPLSGTMNLATVLLRIKIFDKFTILENFYFLVGSGTPKRSITVLCRTTQAFIRSRLFLTHLQVFKPRGIFNHAIWRFTRESVNNKITFVNRDQ